MTLIPETKLSEWHATAKRGAREILAILIEFRDEYMADFRAENCLMQGYEEVATSLMLAPDTARDKIGMLRSYPKDKLLYWFDNDLSFDHLDKANSLAEIAHKAPADLLNEAIDPGNATGATMTVKELTAHALGERPMPAPMYWINRAFSSFGELPHRLNWNEAKAYRWHEWIEQGKELLK